jgi:DNA-binding MarR family transcriptional regulator/GNAT superfamily N-acetyltransferase
MDEIAQIRRFNRTVTRRLGVLEDHFLGRNRSIGASRVLFEIGLSGIDVRELRQRLELDSGYASRLLRSLEAEKLVQVDRSERDARVRFARLTAAGQGELATLNRLSDEVASSMLDRLSEKQRQLLTEAMGTVERLLGVSSITIAVEEPSGRRAQDCIARYFADLDERFEGGFNPGISNSATEKELTPPDGYLAIADLFGEAVGCGALKCHPDYGEIKRMWVSPSERGLGLGRKILQFLEDLARQRGLPLLRLETNKALIEAQGLYRNSGYREVDPFNSEPYAHHWFEKKLG